MTTLTETLTNARTLLLAGKHRLAGMLFVEPLLLEAAGGDAALANEALLALDASTPTPWTFGLFVDGAQWAVEDLELPVEAHRRIVYEHDRRPEEIAAVVNKARKRAEREEA